MRSERLTYRPVEPADLEAFSGLVRDEHDGIVASVDAVNAASVRILEKRGFERFATRPGAFGDMLLFRLTD